MDVPPAWFARTVWVTLKADSAGLISGLADKASQLKHGTGADDHPVVVVEFDTGYVVCACTCVCTCA